MTATLAGRRVVVVGASAGIGRGLALSCAALGADVLAAARRVDRLEELAVEHPGLRTAALDLRSAASRDEFAATARAELGSIDALLVAAGAAPLVAYRATAEEDWLQALTTNLIGVHRVIAGLLDLLTDDSVTVVLSSEAAHEPRSHLGAYGASKAALEHSIEQWREEHPWRRFAVVNLGATIPTEFGNGFEAGPLTEAIDAWSATGRFQALFLSTDEVCGFLADTIAGLLAAPSIDMRTIVLRSPSPPTTDGHAAVAAATSDDAIADDEEAR